MPLVRFAADRFRSRGPEKREDIVQVGMTGLIKAIDRFEPSREVEFTSFAVPWITDEMKRFFRIEELRSRLGRTPTTEELSELMSPLEEEVREARPASDGCNSASPDAAISGREDGEAALAEFADLPIAHASVEEDEVYPALHRDKNVDGGDVDHGVHERREAKVGRPLPGERPCVEGASARPAGCPAGAVRAAAGHGRPVWPSPGVESRLLLAVTVLHGQDRRTD